MNAVIYARYSPGPQQREESIEGQLRECQAFATAHNITVVKEYIDRAQTGRNDNRTEFQRMLRESEKRLFEAVIVWKIDRFGRSREEIAINKVKLKKSGVRVMYAKEHVPDGPEGIILESVLEGMAEYYSANLAQNVRRGMTENALKGKSNGGPTPLGYKVTPEKTYAIDPLTAPIVKEIYEKYAGGIGIKEIVQDLNSRGIKSSKGKMLTMTSLQSVLGNKRYLGIYLFGGEEIKGAMPQIIDQTLFDSVQVRMAKNRHAPARSKAPIPYLLTGKVFCGSCGTPMVGESGVSRNGSIYTYYKCNKNLKEHTCPKTPVSRDALEQFVIKETIQKVLQPEIIDLIVKAAMRVQAENTQSSDLQYYEKQLSDTKKALDNLVRAMEMGIFSDTTQARMLELEANKATLENSVRREKLSRITVTEDQVRYVLNHFRDLNYDQLENRQQLIDVFVRSVIVFEGEQKGSDRKVVINYNYTGGTQSAVAQGVNGSNTDGYAPPK